MTSKSKQNQIRFHWGISCFVIFMFLLFAPSPSFVYAQKSGGIWTTLTRASARVADDVPIKAADNFVADLSKSKATRNAVDAELNRAGRLPGGMSKAARADEVLNLLRNANAKLSPDIISTIGKMDGPSREAALVLVRGGENIHNAIPDVVTRGRLLKNGGQETVAAVGLFGEDAAKAALRLDEAILGGKVLDKAGKPAATTLADFGRVLSNTGGASWSFFKEYVQPHWKIWAASGAFAAYLVNPEYFQDQAGKLTEAGFKHLTSIVGSAVAGGIRGVADGTGKAVEKINTAFWESFINSKIALFAWVGTFIFLGCVSLLFRRVRFWFLMPFRWLNSNPPEQPPTTLSMSGSNLPTSSNPSEQTNTKS